MNTSNTRRPAPAISAEALTGWVGFAWSRDDSLRKSQGPSDTLESQFFSFRQYCISHCADDATTRDWDLGDPPSQCAGRMLRMSPTAQWTEFSRLPVRTQRNSPSDGLRTDATPEKRKHPLRSHSTPSHFALYARGIFCNRHLSLSAYMPVGPPLGYWELKPSGSLMTTGIRPHTPRPNARCH